MRLWREPARGDRTGQGEDRGARAELAASRSTASTTARRLIDETVATLTDALGQETLITIVVVVCFLLHVRASIVMAVTLPMAVLMAFIA
jgi:copper/silver efflux system protein